MQIDRSRNLAPNHRDPRHGRREERARPGFCHTLLLAVCLPLCLFPVGRATAADADGRIKVIESAHPHRWDNVVIGGGGWFTYLAPHPSIPGLLWLGSDVAGPWKREPGDTRWHAQAWNHWSPQNASGVLGLALDPRDALTVYVERGDNGGSMGPPTGALKGLYVTRDGGKHWTLALNKFGTSNVGQSRKWGPSIAVDPNRPDAVYWGTFRDGIWRSMDAGKAWQQVMVPPILPAGQKPETLDPGVRCLAIDPSSRIEGRAAIVYAGLTCAFPEPDSPSGLYRSTDGGDSFQRVPEFSALPGSPEQIRFMYCGTDGTLFVNHELGLARLDKDGLKDITPPTATYFDEGGMAVNPAKPNDVVLLGKTKKRGEGDPGHCAIFRSRDRGETWDSVANDDGQIVAEDLPPWITDFNMNMKMPASGSFLAFDPFHEGRAYLLDAFSVFRIDNIWADRVTLHSMYEGVDDTVTMTLCTPPPSADGKAPPLLTGLADVRGFRHTDIHQPPLHIIEPTVYTEYDWCTAVTGFDYCEGNPSVIMCCKADDRRRQGKVLLSEDGGQTWRMTTYPIPDTNAGGAKIAVSAEWRGTVDTLKAVFAPGNRQTPRYTHDGGKTWKACKTVDGADLPFASVIDHPFNFAQFVAADRVDGDTFYMYNPWSGTFWVSRDGGATWTQKDFSGIKVPDYDSFSPFSIQAAPGRAGEVWAAMSGYGIRRTRDFGATWETLPGVVRIGNNPAGDPADGRPCSVAFGAPAPGRPANEPTVYVFVELLGDETHSLLRSSDIAREELSDFTWERVQKWEFGGIRPTLLQGSRQKYGQVFMEGSCHGVIYGEPTPAPGS
jgi:xyloglucan-specific exo-beta-1,4-glucanase